MKKLTLILAAMVLTASQAFGQCGKCGYEVKAENAYTNYNVRYASNPMDAKHYTTDRLRSEFAIEKVFAPGEVNWTYTMFDRFLIGGAEPTTAPLKLTSIAPLYTDKPNDEKNLLDNRELGIINIGGEGTVTVDGKKYTLGFQEALYVGRGAKNIEVSSKDAAKPAKFYMNSACAHQTYPTKKITLKDANNIKAGSLKESNDRVIHQLIIDGVAGVRTCQLQMGVTELKEGSVTVDGKKYTLGFQEALYVGRGAKNIEVSSKDAAKPAKFYMNSACAHQTYPTKKVTLKDANNIKAGSLKESNDRVIHQLIIDGVAGVRTCQLQMGVTELKEGSVWNTMPAHTHLRRMETYLYYNVPEGQKILHVMGEPQETRPIWLNNEQAVISPEWSIHCAAGTSNYTFIWGMAGENLIYNDMQVVKIPTLE